MLNGVSGAVRRRDSPPAIAPTLPAAPLSVRPTRLGVAAQRGDRHPRVRDGLGDGADRQAGRRRLVAGSPPVVHEVARTGVDVEQHLAEVDGGDAVDEDLVGLRQHGHPATLEALDEVDLPQRPVRVEPARHDPPGQLAELVQGARAGQRGAAYVVGEVEVLVVDPDRVGQAARHPAYVLAVAGHERDPVVDVGEQRVVVEAGVGGVEDLEGRVVHRRLRGLVGQQSEVTRAQSLAHGANPQSETCHHHPRSIQPRPGGLLDHMGFWQSPRSRGTHVHLMEAPCHAGLVSLWSH